MDKKAGSYGFDASLKLLRFGVRCQLCHRVTNWPPAPQLTGSGRLSILLSSSEQVLTIPGYNSLPQDAPVTELTAAGDSIYLLVHISSTISLELVLPCPDGLAGLGCFCFPDLYFLLSSLFSLPIKPASEIEPLINDDRLHLPTPEWDESEVAGAAGWGRHGLLERTIHPGYWTSAVRRDKWLSEDGDPSLPASMWVTSLDLTPYFWAAKAQDSAGESHC